MYEFRNVSHARASARDSAVMDTWWKGLDGPMVRMVRRRRKGLPGEMTLHAKFKNPKRACKARSLILRLAVKRSSKSLAFANLSAGSLASYRSVSSSMPWTVTHVAGQTVLDSLMGMLHELHMFMKASSAR